MKRNKKVLLLLLIGVLFLVTSGCNKTATVENSAQSYVPDPNLNEPGVFPVCKERITITVGIPKDPLVIDYETNQYTKFIEEKMNCDLKFVYLPSTVDEAKGSVK